MCLFRVSCLLLVLIYLGIKILNSSSRITNTSLAILQVFSTQYKCMKLPVQLFKETLEKILYTTYIGANVFTFLFLMHICTCGYDMFVQHLRQY